MGCNSSKVRITPEDIVKERRESRSIFNKGGTFANRIKSLFRRKKGNVLTSSPLPTVATEPQQEASKTSLDSSSAVLPGTAILVREAPENSGIQAQGKDENQAETESQIEDDIFIDDNLSCESLSPRMPEVEVTRLSMTADGQIIARPKAAKGARTMPAEHPQDEVVETRVRGSASTPEPPVATLVPGLPPHSAVLFGETERENYLDKRIRPKAAKGERKPPNLPQQFNAELAEMTLPGTPDFPTELSPKRRQEETCLTAWMERRIKEEGAEVVE